MKNRSDFFSHQKIGGRLFFLLIFFIIGLALQALFSALYVILSGSSLEQISSSSVFLTMGIITQFFIPVALYILLFGKNRRLLPLRNPTSVRTAWLGFSLVIFIVPSIELLSLLNAQIPFPAWLIEGEYIVEASIGRLLADKSLGGILFNFFSIAILTGIGEELLFRGIIQEELLRWFKRPHLAVWVSGLFFALVHWQFLGVIPRTALGVILGYALLYSRSLWIPIAMHIWNNAAALFAVYFVGQDLKITNQIGTAITSDMWIMGLISLSICALIIFYLSRRSCGKKLWENNE